MATSEPRDLGFFAQCQDMGIDALKLVTKQIDDEVQSLADMLPAQAGVLYTGLLQSLYSGFAHGLAIMGGLMNSVAPVNRIPPELLTSIFALSPGTISHTATGIAGSEIPYWPFEEPDIDDLHKLTKVCRYWRDLAIATPILWTTVVTHHNYREHDIYFRRSKYLHEDPSLDLKLAVHFSPPTRGNPKGSAKRMVKFILTNASKIRELHAWNVSNIYNLSAFLHAFDAHALEHCTIWEPDRKHMRFPPPGTLSLPLFYGPADRLRSLCLTDIHDLPEKAFPALTLLVIAYIKPDVIVRWRMDDLLALLAGSPRLEEVYVHNMYFMTYSTRSPNAGPSEPTPISLPRLQHLAFTYRPETGHADDINPADVLLARIAPIPPACHMVFTAVGGGRDEGSTRRDDSARRDASTRRALDILSTLRSRVPGKDAVSHVFLRLFSGSTTIQLVFAPGHGSLRLQLPVAAAVAPPRNRLGMLRPTPADDAAFTKPLDVFGAVPALFAQTEELRIHYDGDGEAVEAALAALPAAFPRLKTLAVVRDVDWERPGWQAHGDATRAFDAGLMHLVKPSTGSGTSTGSGSSGSRDAGKRTPYPALETLWVALERADEVGSLESVLSNRAHSGVPLRRVVVTLYHAVRADAGSDVPARLRELHTNKMEKVMVMELDEGSAGGLREVDWLVRLPVGFSLPPAIHRDWPVIRHGRN